MQSLLIFGTIPVSDYFWYYSTAVLIYLCSGLLEDVFIHLIHSGFLVRQLFNKTSDSGTALNS